MSVSRLQVSVSRATITRLAAGEFLMLLVTSPAAGECISCD